MLRSARTNKGLSQKNLAERLGISESYISKLENNHKYNKNVTVDLIRKIATELEVDAVDVFLYFYEQSKAKIDQSTDE